MVPSSLTAVRVPFKHSHAKKSTMSPFISLASMTTEAANRRWVVGFNHHTRKKSKRMNASGQTVSQGSVDLTSYFKRPTTHFGRITARGIPSWFLGRHGGDDGN